MRSFISSRCARVALFTITVVFCIQNVAPAGPSEWIGGLFKSKKAVKKQPSMVNVPNFSVDPNDTLSQANASVTAAAEAATRQLNQTVARQGVRPSQMAVPVPVRNQTTDQYLSGLLKKAQATPQAQGQFATKFPELRSDFRRTKLQQPTTNATDAGAMAAWMGKGTAVPAATAATNKPANPKTKAVQVAHTDEVNGQSLADWANVPVTNSPAATAVANALTGTEPGSVEPVVPEQYRNMKIPGLPEDARIMSVQDRVVSPAVIPGSNQTAATSLAPPMASSGVPVEIENMVPQIIDNTVPQPTLSFAAPQAGMSQMQTPTTVLGPPTAAIGQPMTTLQAPTMIMQSPQIAVSPQNVYSQAMLAPSTPMNAQVAPTGMTRQPSFPVTQQTMGIPQQTQMTQSSPIQQHAGIPTGMPVQLTMEQIRNLPPGTKLIPANDAAVAALRNQHSAASQATAAPAPQITQAPAQIAASPKPRIAATQAPQMTPAPATAWAGPVAANTATTPVSNVQQIKPATAAKTRMRTTTIKPGKIVRSSKPTAIPATNSVTTTSQTVDVPASIGVPATVAASAASQIPSAPATTTVSTPVTEVTPAEPSGPTQSMLVKDRLNRAFEICRTDPITAESEFLAILRYVSKAHDDAEGLDSYAPAFERGLLTLREAERMQDTLMTRGEEAAIKLSHSLQCEVSQSYSEGKIATADVVDAYYLYARHSMMIAIGEQPLGSQALYGWGQLCSTRSQRPGYNNGIEQGKASLILAAALDADETNWRAHNEMGIIFARQGEYAESEKSFRQSLALNPTDETYNNIAKVVDRQANPSISSGRMPTLTREPEGTSTYVQSNIAPTQKTAGTNAQVGAQQPLGEESSRRSKVKAFVDRLMGNDELPQSYQDDDGIPITAN